MYAAVLKYKTLVSVLPRSAMLVTFGRVAGSHMIICGFFSNGANTSMVG